MWVALEGFSILVFLNNMCLDSVPCFCHLCCYINWDINKAFKEIEKPGAVETEKKALTSSFYTEKHEKNVNIDYYVDELFS